MKRFSTYLSILPLLLLLCQCGKSSSKPGGPGNDSANTKPVLTHEDSVKMMHTEISITVTHLIKHLQQQKLDTINSIYIHPYYGLYFVFRPGAIEPLHGIRSKTPSYQLFYSLLGPLLSLLRRAFPNLVTTTEAVGRAMLVVAKRGAPKAILESRDIVALARG